MSDLQRRDQKSCSALIGYASPLLHMTPCDVVDVKVELPRVNDCPGASVTSRSHDDLLSRGNVALGQLHCLGASSSSSDHYEFI